MSRPRCGNCCLAAASHLLDYPRTGPGGTPQPEFAKLLPAAFHRPPQRPATTCEKAIRPCPGRPARAYRLRPNTLLGEVIKGTICSDRWSAYNIVSVYRRQVCWAHLKRDFQKCVEYGGESARVGRAGLRVIKEVFELWHLFRGGGCTRQELIDRVDPIAARLHSWLEHGQQCAPSKVATFCENLLKLAPALWKFVVCEGVEPTNNHAEQVLRRGVLWRKCSFGSQSDAGCRFVERMLTAVQTLRLQKRPVLAWLTEALTAHRNHLPAPSLLPTD